jgi:conjugal transfer pilus assembly protein TraA
MNMTLLKGKGQFLKMLPALAAVAVAGLFGSTAAIAGGDATFNTALTQFTGYLEGSGGRIITIMSLLGGGVALASGQFRIGQLAIPVGVGVLLGSGVPIVTSALTGTI